MRTKNPKQRGFTLPEMMMSMVIFSLVMALTVMVLRGGEEQVHLVEAKMHLQESTREALYRMGQDIRESSPSRTTVINGGVGLTIQIPASVDNSGGITWSSPITFQVGGNGTQLIRTDTGIGQTTILANDIQSVVFTVSGNPVATVAYTVAAQRTLTNNRVLSVNSTGEARLRNA